MRQDSKRERLEERERERVDEEKRKEERVQQTERQRGKRKQRKEERATDSERERQIYIERRFLSKPSYCKPSIP